MKCTYWESNTSRHIGKGLALLIKGKRMGFKRFNLIVYSDWYYNTTFALIVDCIY